MGQSLMDLYKIIHLHRQFKKYDKYTYSQLVESITPSINLNQYQIFYKDKEPIGFINWAFITDEVEQRFMITGKLKKNEWNCGDNIWIIDCVCKSNFYQIYSWCRDYFKSITNEHQKVKWIRTNNMNHIYRTYQTEHRIYG